jgi:pentatricopeptide repeat protein
MMHVYARRKTPRKAVHCMRQLMLSGQRPGRLVFNGLLAAYAAVGRAEVALATFTRMQSEGITPDTHSYEHLIAAFVAAGHHKAAAEWAAAMQTHGLAVTPAIRAFLTASRQAALVAAAAPRPVVDVDTPPVTHCGG